MLTIYTKRGFCAQCRQTKLFLAKQGTKYEEVVVEETDEEMLQNLRDQGFGQFPVVIADGVTFTGFRPDRLELLV